MTRTLSKKIAALGVGVATLCVASAASAQASYTQPDSVTASGITVSSGSLGLLIDGDTSATGFYTNINPGVDYFELGYDEAVSVTALRIYNDFGGDDDGVERFDLEYLDENGQRIRYDAGFVIDNGPGTIDVPVNVVQGVRAIRFFVIEAQHTNNRCQIREIQFETQAFNPDADGDGFGDDVDNCPNDANPGQEDGDLDGIGDACDPCPAGQSDDDNDGVCDDVDNCPGVSNNDQTDDNGDGYGDACVSPLASVGNGVSIPADALIGPNADIGNFVIIGAGASIDGAVADDASIGAGSTVGTGCVIGSNTAVGANVGLGDNCNIGSRASIGDAVTLGLGAAVGARSVVGANTSMGAGASLGISASIGDGSSVPDNVSIGDNSHLGTNAQLGAGTGVGANTIVGDNLSLGLGSTIGNNVRMAGDATIGANSSIRSQASVDGNLQMGAGSEIASGGVVGSNCVIGDGVEMRGEIRNSVTLEDSTFVGNQSSLGDNCVMRANATTGQFVTVGNGCDLGSEVAIFSGSELGTNATIGARTQILFRTSIGNNAMIGTDNLIDEQIDIGNTFTMGDNSRLWPFSSFGDDVTVGDGVLIRNNAIVESGVTFESGALIYPRTTIGSDTTIRADVELGVADCRAEGCGNVNIGGCLDISADVDAFATVDGGCAVDEGGDNNEGDGNALATNVVNDYTYMTADASAGANTITVDDATAFAVGDEIIIVQMQGPGQAAGTYEPNVIASVNGNTLGLRGALTSGFLSGTFDQGGARATQVVRVPNYDTFTVNDTVTAPAWDGYTGGIVAIRATTAIVFDGGAVDVSAVGFRGPERENLRHTNGRVGEGVLGNPLTRCVDLNTVSATGTGGCGAIEGTSHSNDGVAAAGGGANGADAPSGGFAYQNSRHVAQSGVPFRDAAANLLVLGGGGGQGDSGSNDWSALAKGGNGGGAVILIAPRIVSPAILANGEGGEQGCDYWGTGGDWGVSGGGGGAGGSVLLISPDVVGGTIDAYGGPGGDICGHAGAALSYSGGGGRVYVQTGHSFVGESDPAADVEVSSVGSLANPAGETCLSILNAGQSEGSGYYWIDPDGAGGADPFETRCDMDTRGGGWTLGYRDTTVTKANVYNTYSASSARIGDVRVEDQPFKVDGSTLGGGTTQVMFMSTNVGADVAGYYPVGDRQFAVYDDSWSAMGGNDHTSCGGITFVNGSCDVPSLNMSYASRTGGPWVAPQYFFSDTISTNLYWRTQLSGYVYLWHMDGFAADAQRFQADPTTIRREIWVR